MRWVGLTLLCWHVGAMAQATAPLTEQVLGRLATIETLRGEFVQSREIAALSQPLRSSGRFIVSELGLYWEQREPFRTLLIAREDSLTQQIADQPVTTVSSVEQPMAVSISRIFLGLFAGQISKLEQDFKVRLDGSSQGWTLSLEPRTYPLTEAIKAITVEGSELLRTIRVDGSAGDRLTVELFGQSAEPTALSPQERALYFP